MSYRPQFAFPTPPGFHDEPFEYFFDYTNTPALLFNLLQNQPLNDIPLTLESDSEFHARGLQVGAFETMGPLGVRFKDAAGNDLSSDFVPVQEYSGYLRAEFEGGEAMPLEPEIVNPPAGIPRVSLQNFAGGPWPRLLPGLMLPLVSTSVVPSVGALKMECHAVGGSGASAMPFYYAGQLYMLLQTVSNTGTSGTIGVYRWDPKLQTWGELDAANHPIPGNGNGPSCAVLFDGVHTITVGWNPTTGAGGLGALTLQDFDLSTGTWVTPSAYPAGPNVFGVNQLFRRSDGTIVVITGGVTATPFLHAQVLTAGVWSTVALDTNLPGGQTSNGGSAAVYDPASDLIHIFGIANTGGPNAAFYQAFDLTNALGTFVSFSLADFDLNKWGMGNPVIVGNSIYFGVIDPTNTFASYIVGTPLAAPAFSAPTVNIDPGGPAVAGFGGGAPSLAYDPISGYMYAAYPVTGGEGLRFAWALLSQGIWKGTWIGQLFNFTSADGTTYGAGGGSIQYPVVGVSNQNVFVAFDVNPIGFGQPTEILFQLLTEVSIPITLRGVKRFGPVTCEIPKAGGR